MARRSPPRSQSSPAQMAPPKMASSSPSPPPPHTAFLPDNLHPSPASPSAVTTARFRSFRFPAARNLPTLLEPPASPHPAEAPPPLPPRRFKPRQRTASSLANSSPTQVSASRDTTAPSPSPAYSTPRISRSHAQPVDSPLRVAALLRPRAVSPPACTKCA